jgi:hypothetical protein
MFAPSRTVAPRPDVGAQAVSQVDDSVVLDVRALAHADHVYVAPEHGAVEDAGSRPKHHVADNRGIGRDKRCAVYFGPFAQMPL